MPYPPVILLAALGIYGAVVGIKELGHEAKLGGKQLWCVVRTRHGCPKKSPAPLPAADQVKSPDAENQ